MVMRLNESAAGGSARVLLIELNGVVVGVSENGVTGSGFQGEQFLDGCSECFVDVWCAFRARFQEGQPSVGFAPSANLLGGNGSGLQVGLVCDDDEGEELRFFDVGVIKELLAPHGNILEALNVIDGESQDTNVRAAIKRSSKTSESFLTSRVPYLQRVWFTVEGDFFVKELDADCVEALFVESVANVSIHQRTLPDAAVAEQNHFQQGTFALPDCCCATWLLFLFYFQCACVAKLKPF